MFVNIDRFEENLAKVPDLYVKCQFDNSGSLSDIDMHPLYERLVMGMLHYNNPPMIGVLRVVSFMSLLAAKNGSDNKSCRVFFEAITCSVASKNNVTKEQYHKLLADYGYYGTKQ